MRMNRALLGGAFAIAVLVLVALPALAADESDMAGRAAAWQEAFNSGDLEGVAALYAEDGCRMPPNMETAEGTAAIVENFQGARDMGVAEVQVTVTTAESVGDLAYGSGTYEVMDADGASIDHGKWLNVSKRINGEWKIYCDIWNSDTPLPTP